MTFLHRSRATHRVLTLQALEQRDVPTANVLATVSPAHLLTLIGNDLASHITIKRTGANVVITPDATTEVNGNGAATIVTLTGVATSLKANLKGGADYLAIDNASDFILTGAATINLGDGANTLDMTTSQKIELGSLVVTGGDGHETVNVVAGAGLGKVSGTASLNFGIGNSTTTLTEMKFLGASGLKVADGGVSGFSSLSLTNATVTKTLAAAVGSGGGSLFGFTGCTLGGLSGAGNTYTVNLTNTTVNGNVLLNALSQCFVGTGGAFTAGNVSINGKLISSFNVGGTATTVNGNLMVSGSLRASIGFASTGLSEVKGNIKINGGSWNDSFTTNANFEAEKDVNLNFGSDNNLVVIGNGATPVEIHGNVLVRSGGGNDAITLNNVMVSKTTKLLSGAGADTLTIDNGSIFFGTFTADLGAGDDTVSVAQNPAPADFVHFQAKATIKTGAGNDALLLGVGAGGTPNSKAAFNGAGSHIDGGSGFNSFDDGAPMQYSGLTFGTSIANFTDPNP